MQKISLSLGNLYQPKLIDNEWLEIIRHLKHYGFSSTGSKSGDYALLKKIESRKIEQNNLVLNLLTVSPSEQQKIQDYKQETEKKGNTDLNLLEAADLLGKQLFLTTKINNEGQKKKYE